jgi:hypothetical protein
MSLCWIGQIRQFLRELYFFLIRFFSATMHLIRLIHPNPRPAVRRRRSLSSLYYGTPICIQEVKFDGESLVLVYTSVCYVITLVGVFVYGTNM